MARQPHPHTSDLESIAGLVHAVQAFGYLLGLMYHIRKDNKLETAICSVSLPYHAWATIKHIRRAHRLDSIRSIDYELPLDHNQKEGANHRQDTHYDSNEAYFV